MTQEHQSAAARDSDPEALSPDGTANRAGPKNLGELQPVGGGDPIPLLKTTLLIGRRESCDIVLRFPNVSGAHCELSLVDGHWFVKDLGSSNGTKLNGTRVSEGRIGPGDKISVARHEYEVCYDPSSTGADMESVFAAPQRDIFSRSLLDSAGLVSRRTPRAPVPDRPDATSR